MTEFLISFADCSIQYHSSSLITVVAQIIAYEYPGRRNRVYSYLSQAITEARKPELRIHHHCSIQDNFRTVTHVLHDCHVRERHCVEIAWKGSH
jgi:hypothetical protein